jgi:hypothetical protein
MEICMQTPLLSLLLNLVLSVGNIILPIEDLMLPIENLMVDGGCIATTGGRRLFCIHTYTHLYMHTCTHIHTYTYTYTHIYAYIRTYTYTYTHIYIHIHNTYTHIHTYTHIYKQAHIGLKRIDMIVISIRTWVG